VEPQIFYCRAVSKCHSHCVNKLLLYSAIFLYPGQIPVSLFFLLLFLKYAQTSGKTDIRHSGSFEGLLYFKATDVGEKWGMV